MKRLIPTTIVQESIFHWEQGWLTWNRRQEQALTENVLCAWIPRTRNKDTFPLPCIEFPSPQNPREVREKRPWLTEIHTGILKLECSELKCSGRCTTLEVDDTALAESQSADCLNWATQHCTQSPGAPSLELSIFFSKTPSSQRSCKILPQCPAKFFSKTCILPKSKWMLQRHPHLCSPKM